MQGRNDDAALRAFKRVAPKSLELAPFLPFHSSLPFPPSIPASSTLSASSSFFHPECVFLRSTAVPWPAYKPKMQPQARPTSCRCHHLKVPFRELEGLGADESGHGGSMPQAQASAVPRNARLEPLDVHRGLVALLPQCLSPRRLYGQPGSCSPGQHRWGLILPNSSRVSLLTYKAIVECVTLNL